jgi:polar amino acid transport system substrate-binding protein
MRGRIVLAGVAVVLVAVGIAAPASARADSPRAIARHILGHAPRGLARTVVDRGAVIVANDANYRPQSFIDNHTGKLRGFDVSVARRVAGILGLKVRFVNPAWETVPRGLRRGKFDVSIGSMEITPAREAILSFVSPYHYSAAQVFVKKGGPQITGVGDLFGRRVGVGKDTPYEDYLEQYPQIRLKVYQTDADGFPDLRSGKIRFLLTDRRIGWQAMKRGQPIEASGRAFFHAKLAFALREGESDWWELLNYTVWRMHRSGALRDLSMKWYHHDWTTWRWQR